MKLLFDENLSFRLERALATIYPGSAHVRTVGLLANPDTRIWQHAKDQGFAIVSKDNDFRQMSFLSGPPPKVVWLDVGNSSTDQICDLLRREQIRIETFDRDPETSLLVISINR